MVLAVVLGRGYHPFLLIVSKRFFGKTVVVGGFRSYFRKNQIIPIFGNSVYLTFGAAVVSLYNNVTLFNQVLGSQFLSQIAYSFTFHF